MCIHHEVTAYEQYTNGLAGIKVTRYSMYIFKDEHMSSIQMVLQEAKWHA
jgi:hypothetical protein